MTALRRARVTNGLSFARTYLFLIGVSFPITLLKVASKEVYFKLDGSISLIRLADHF